MMRRTAVLALLLAFSGVSAGCAGSDRAFGVEDDRFVDMMVSLRRASVEAGADTAAFTAARDRILEEYDVTEDSLRAYVQRRSADLDLMAAIWDSVNARLSVQQAE